jgi:hypothetical protein
MVSNTEESKRVRLVLMICDSKRAKIDTKGSKVVDLNPSATSVMQSFTALRSAGPLQLHFMATHLPLVPGAPIYHTCLFVNVA